MAKYNLLLPRMGESVSEATVVKWLKQPGDSIEIDDSVLDIATDKVDSEVPSPIAGTLIEQLFKENEIAQVGEAIAILEVNDADLEDTPAPFFKETPVSISVEERVEIPKNMPIPGIDQLKDEEQVISTGDSGRFYSPLVKNIAAEEGIGLEELDKINGSGSEGRVTKQDILDFIASKNEKVTKEPDPIIPQVQSNSIAEGDEIIEMDRMRKIIAEHMVASVQTSPHVCSFVEADVTNVVHWKIGRAHV